MTRSTVVVAMIAMLVGAVPGVSAQALAEGERIRITERDAGVAAEISQELGESLPTPRKFAGIVGSLDDAPSLIELQNGNIPRRVLTAGSLVRIRHAAESGQLQGVVASVDDTALTLVEKERGVRVRIPISSITHAEMKVGEKRHWLRGGWWVLGSGC